MKRPDLGNSDLAGLDEAYNRLSSQHWDAIAEEPISWWETIINWLLILAIAGALSMGLYVWLWGFE